MSYHKNLQHQSQIKFEGAYVKDPQVGMHKWVMSFDLNSLYPHLIMQYNISPETLLSQDKIKDMKVDKLLNKEFDTSQFKEKNVTMTPNGAMFKTDKKGFLPEIMESMYNDRVKYKNLMLKSKQEYENTKDPKILKEISKYNNIQMAKKISLNSLMVQSVTTGFVTIIYWLQKRLLPLVSYLFVGLKNISINILTKFWELITRIMFLHQIQTLCILLLTSWLTSLLKQRSGIRE